MLCTKVLKHLKRNIMVIRRSDYYKRHNLIMFEGNMHMTKRLYIKCIYITRHRVIKNKGNIFINPNKCTKDAGNANI
jgi:hypothetical protein